MTDANGADTAGMPLPGWGSIARSAFRFLVPLWGLGIMINFAMILVRDLTDADPNWPTWMLWPFRTIMAAVFVSGLVYLAGALVTGYREPRNDRDPRSRDR